MYKKIYPVVLASLLLAGCSSTGGTNTTVVSLETTAGTVKVAAEDVNGETIVVEYDASVVPESSEAAFAESEAAATLPASSEAESETAVETAIASSEAESSSASMASSSAEETTIAIDGFTATGTIRCISDGARVRETPRGTILGNLSYGDIVQTDGVTENGWIHIWSESFGIGYVYQDFVTSVQ